MASSGFVLGLFQQLVYAVTVLAALAVCISVGWASNVSKGNCVLYADMTIQLGENDTIRFRHAVWGDEQTCLYCTFLPVTVLAYTAIGFSMFLSTWCGDGQLDANYHTSKAQRAVFLKQLLPATLLFNVVFWVCATICASYITQGTARWCDSMRDVLGSRPCSYTSEVTWVGLPGASKAYTYLLIAQICAWVMMLAILTSVVITWLRIRHVANYRRKRRHQSRQTSGVDNPNYEHLAPEDDDYSKAMRRASKLTDADGKSANTQGDGDFSGSLDSSSMRSSPLEGVADGDGERKSLLTSRHKSYETVADIHDAP